MPPTKNKRSLNQPNKKLRNQPNNNCRGAMHCAPRTQSNQTNWNRQGGYNIMADPAVIRIFDTTLRDGEQSPGATMTTEEKLLVAEQLVRLMWISSRRVFLPPLRVTWRRSRRLRVRLAAAQA